jgi:sugar phosphate isomerase/epimerase
MNETHAEMRNPVAFMASLGYAEVAPGAVCESLASLDYDGVEWPFQFFDPRSTTAEDRRMLVTEAERHGLAVSELVVQQDYVTNEPPLREDRILLTLECIDAAADCGVSVVNLFTGPAPWNPASPRIGVDLSEGSAWTMVLDAFERILPRAEDRQVHLAVEGVWGMLCRDYYTTRLLIDHFDSPYLGVNFDPSHDVLAGNLDVGWILRQWDEKRRIKHIHLKDAVGTQEAGKFVFPLLGEGNVDWNAFAGALAASGYDGFVSVEFESFGYYRNVLGNDAEQAARLSMMQIRRLFGK